MEEGWKRHWQDLAFAAIFAVTSFAFFWTIGPFIVPLLLAAAAVALLAPLHEHLNRWLGNRRRLSSALAAALTLLIILIPLGLIAFYLVKQAAIVIASWSVAISEGGLEALLSGRIREPLAPLLRSLDSLGLTHYLRETLEEAAAFLSTHLGSITLTIVRLLVKAFVIILGMYYFFLDGPWLIRSLVALAPLEERHSREILEDLNAILRALFLASFVTAVIQGILGVISFWIAGLPHAIVWAALMAFLGLIFSLVPIIGTGLVYVPAGIWLIANDKIFGGIFVLLWGTLILGSVEFVVKPYFAKERVHLHPLTIFLTLFGGIQALGAVGAVAGPVLAALVASFTRVWRRDIVGQIPLFSKTP